MPKPWLAWIAALMIVNMIVPLFFITSLEAKAILAAFMLGALLQTAIFSRKGFVRLLGLGHIAWIPLAVWLWIRFEAGSSEGIFSYWLVAVIVLNTTSLMIDVVDVARYVRGERTPQVEA
jgi:hypothetical protein